MIEEVRGEDVVLSVTLSCGSAANAVVVRETNDVRFELEVPRPFSCITVPRELDCPVRRAPVGSLAKEERLLLPAHGRAAR